MNTQNPEFTWKRQPEGGYVARHGFWVYNVYRNDRAAKGRQWNLKAWPEGNPEAAQERTGLATATVAKLAATHTGCFICGRHFPFGTLKRQPGRSSTAYPTWVCRDEQQCYVERKRITAESRERILEMRRIDHTEIFVREAQYGPELVFRSGDSGTVINVTEGDLDKVAEVVRQRRAAAGE